jgi:transposase
MARAYSSDLRDRVVAAVMAGATVRSAADRFGVSVASAVKWSQRFRATGSAAARPRGGKKPYVLVGQREWLLARIAEAPDLTLRAVMLELADRGVVASYHAVWDFFAHEGVTFKKKPARRRTEPAGRGEEAGALAASPGEA